MSDGAYLYALLNNIKSQIKLDASAEAFVGRINSTPQNRAPPESAFGAELSPPAWPASMK